MNVSAISQNGLLYERMEIGRIRQTLSGKRDKVRSDGERVLFGVMHSSLYKFKNTLQGTI